MSRRIVFLILLAGITIECRSVIGRPLNLDELVDSSDTIVTGVATDVRLPLGSQPSQASPSTPGTGTVAIDVQQIVKGSDVPSAITVRFPGNMPILGLKGTVEGDFRVYFLHRSGTDYVFTSPSYASLPFHKGTYVAQDPEETIVQGLVSTIEMSSDMSNRLLAIRALDTSKKTMATEALRKVSNSTEPSVHLSVATALVRRNDVTALTQIERAFGDPKQIPANLLNNANAAIREGIHDSSAIPTLRRLLKSESPVTREAAVTALMHTKSAAAVPALVEALGDPEREIQFVAVTSLGEINGFQKANPSREQFFRDSASYLSRWRTWARDNGFSE
ncbi:HEAT repeat domain-containing protein [Terriglobus albidus]|uniref:HEAT repeat domain-containing protein n=1 Tax=Terriglobus albidus TaxID=1592106 RepID=UPI0021E08703|nr:HEAT repeat domain-containing protein [Terriglobus albidus]